jgi:hypothetical protein
MKRNGEKSQKSTFNLTCSTQAAGLHHLYYIPQAKLIFCGIPKVGISEWIKFFRHTYGAKDYLSTPYYKHDTAEFHISKLPLEKAQTLCNDPTWVKAAIWRDPAERLMSAYLDKIVRERYTQKYFYVGKDDPHYVLTFEEFVMLVTTSNVTDHHDRRGLHYRVDPHWRPQLFAWCGMDHTLPLFDFIGSFDYLPEHTKLLLERVGIWESYGKIFSPSNVSSVGHRGGNTCMIPPPDELGDDDIAKDVPYIGFNQRQPIGNKHSVQHGTRSKSKVGQYYTPELSAMVRTAYASDYAIWDELQGRIKLDSINVPRGLDFHFVQNSCVIDSDIN